MRVTEEGLSAKARGPICTANPTSFVILRVCDFLSAVPQVRARFLGANLGAAAAAGMLIVLVILSAAKDLLFSRAPGLRATSLHSA
jgi:hypothetical protein